MQIVSKWHSGRRIRGERKPRIAPVDRILKTKDGRSHKEQQVKSAVRAAEPDRHALIAAQVIASRFVDDADLSFEVSNSIAGSRAYQSALERKVHKMDRCSFYQEAV